MRYRAMASGTWDDERFNDLSDRAQLLWLRLLTGPERDVLPGVYLLGRGYWFDVFSRWPAADVDAAWADLIEHGMAVVEWGRRTVWLPNAVRYNRPANANMVTGWRKHFDEIPEGALRPRILRAFQADSLQWTDTCRMSFETLFRALLETCSETGSETGIGTRSQTGSREGEGEGEGTRGHTTRRNREPVPFALTAPSTAKKVKQRARRRPEDCMLTDARFHFAVGEGLNPSQIEREWAKMGDHEYARLISDWDGAWRNWVRGAIERYGIHRAVPATTAGARSIESARRLVDEARDADARKTRGGK